MCSKSPFLLDLWCAALAQFGQSEDLLKINMAHISRSSWESHSTSKSLRRNVLECLNLSTRSTPIAAASVLPMVSSNSVNRIIRVFGERTLQNGCHLSAAQSWKGDVQKNQIRLQLLCRIYSLYAVFRFTADFISLMFQQGADETANGRVIVHDEKTGLAIFLLRRDRLSIQDFL